MSLNPIVLEFVMSIAAYRANQSYIQDHLGVQQATLGTTNYIGLGRPSVPVRQQANPIHRFLHGLFGDVKTKTRPSVPNFCTKTRLAWPNQRRLRRHRSMSRALHTMVQLYVNPSQILSAVHDPVRVIPPWMMMKRSTVRLIPRRSFSCVPNVDGSAVDSKIALIRQNSVCLSEDMQAIWRGIAIIVEWLRPLPSLIV